MTLYTRTLWRRGLLAIVFAVAALASAVPMARADSTFHTERIPLLPAAAGIPLQSGFVVDIHANGPTIYALERYVLNGATPNTTYQVVSQIYLDPACGTNSFPPIPDATLQTNAAGNGEAGSVIAPALITQFHLHNVTLGIIWQVWSGGSLAYQTACIPVKTD